MNYTGGELSMMFLLPKLGEIEVLEANLTPELLDRVIKESTKAHVPVRLPRFKFADQYSLVDSLKALGRRPCRPTMPSRCSG